MIFLNCEDSQVQEAKEEVLIEIKNFISKRITISSQKEKCSYALTSRMLTSFIQKVLKRHGLLI